MTMEEILAGESGNVEFKENLPEKSTEYMKTVVAFANGSGGKIIFGIADKTREVVGFDNEDVFKKMDAIANAVSDSCAPAIIPDITAQTIDGKTVIVVEVCEGRQRPYYIRALGREGGVYVRVAGTTRPADESMIKELLFEGSSRHFDQALCAGLAVTDDEIDDLCNAMKEQAVRNAHTESQKASVRAVGRQQLLSWGILLERDGKTYPTNAFAILTGCGGLHAVTQCGVFKGTTKEIFVDRREYAGPLWEQLEEAYQYVLRNIHLGAIFKGLYRQDVYEIPPDAIRELIINAMVHRSYLDHGMIQVAVYDDRLEITSPGKLPMGQTIERMKEGYSKIRNEALAYAFLYMNLIEHWGSGIPRIIARVKAAGLREPEFLGGDVDLRINIYRSLNEADSAVINATNNANDTENGVNEANNATINATNNANGTENGVNEAESGTINAMNNANGTENGVNEANNATNNATINANDTGNGVNDADSVTKTLQAREQALIDKLLCAIEKNPSATQLHYAEQIGVSKRTVSRIFASLQEKGILMQKGTKRKANWLIMKHETQPGC